MDFKRPQVNDIPGIDERKFSVVSDFEFDFDNAVDTIETDYKKEEQAYEDFKRAILASETSEYVYESDDDDDDYDNDYDDDYDDCGLQGEEDEVEQIDYNQVDQSQIDNSLSLISNKISKGNDQVESVANIEQKKTSSFYDSDNPNIAVFESVFQRSQSILPDVPRRPPPSVPCSKDKLPANVESETTNYDENNGNRIQIINNMAKFEFENKMEKEKEINGSKIANSKEEINPQTRENKEEDISNNRLSGVITFESNADIPMDKNSRPSSYMEMEDHKLSFSNCSPKGTTMESASHFYIPECEKTQSSFVEPPDQNVNAALAPNSLRRKVSNISNSVKMKLLTQKSAPMGTFYLEKMNEDEIEDIDDLSEKEESKRVASLPSGPLLSGSLSSDSLPSGHLEIDVDIREETIKEEKDKLESNKRLNRVIKSNSADNIVALGVSNSSSRTLPRLIKSASRPDLTERRSPGGKPSYNFFSSSTSPSTSAPIERHTSILSARFGTSKSPLTVILNRNRSASAGPPPKITFSKAEIDHSLALENENKQVPTMTPEPITFQEEIKNDIVDTENTDVAPNAIMEPALKKTVTVGTVGTVKVSQKDFEYARSHTLSNPRIGLSYLKRSNSQDNIHIIGKDISAPLNVRLGGIGEAQVTNNFKSLNQIQHTVDNFDDLNSLIEANRNLQDFQNVTFQFPTLDSDTITTSCVNFTYEVNQQTTVNDILKLIKKDIALSGSLVNALLDAEAEFYLYEYWTVIPVERVLNQKESVLQVLESWPLCCTGNRILIGVKKTITENRNTIVVPNDNHTLDQEEFPFVDGWMYKMGKVFKTWKLRYFKLMEGGIFYFKEDPEKMKRKAIPLGSVSFMNSAIYTTRKSFKLAPLPYTFLVKKHVGQREGTKKIWASTNLTDLQKEFEECRFFNVSTPVLLDKWICAIKLGDKIMTNQLPTLLSYQK